MGPTPTRQTASRPRATNSAGTDSASAGAVAWSIDPAALRSAECPASIIADRLEELAAAIGGTISRCTELFGTRLGTGDGTTHAILRARESARRNRIAAEPDRGLFRVAPQGPHVAELTDEQLLSATIDGDRDAFATLVERYRDELLHFLIRFLASRSAAEDVFQETFLQVYTAARTFDPERRLKPWLFTIAANKARDHFRRNRRQPSLSLSAPIGEGGGDSFIDLLKDDSAAPGAPLDDLEQAAKVRRVVDGLSTHHREILLLSYFQRMSYQQMSESLEIPLGTVKSRLHAAVASFASAWRAAGGDTFTDESEETIE